MSPDSRDSFWPQWLADDLKDMQISTVGYEASFSNWTGSSMSIVERAANLLDLLKTNKMGDHPMLFICHSMGGLLFKQMFRIAGETLEQHWFRDHCTGVIFLATPHTGSRLASWVRWLPKIIRPTVSLRELEADHSQLIDLNRWCQNNENFCALSIKVFYENKNSVLVRVVDQASGNLTFPGVNSVALDADHFSICKPDSRDSDIERENALKEGWEKARSGFVEREETLKRELEQERGKNRDGLPA